MTASEPVLVARQWVDRRAEVDPLTGALRTDARTSGASDADDAALAWALELGAAWGAPVVAATVGPAECEAVLADPLALGAARAVRVQPAPDDPDEADRVAAALAAVARRHGAGVIVCGDLGLTAGSGAVPALVADTLGVAQALGLVGLSYRSDRPGELEGLRRLDRGRRERLALTAPCVVSVEGGTCPLPRAPLSAVLSAAEDAVEVIDALPDPGAGRRPTLVRRGPFRPRTHVVAAPPSDLDTFERVLVLTGGDAPRTPPQTLTLEPAAAAERIEAALRQWEDEV